MVENLVRYAFRCRSCNSLEEAGHAGERALPRRCRTCGAGGQFDTNTGLFVENPDNWIVLADLAEEDLAPILEFHALGAHEIVRHEPAPPADPEHVATAIDVRAEDGTSIVDAEEGARP